MTLSVGFASLFSQAIVHLDIDPTEKSPPLSELSVYIRKNTLPDTLAATRAALQKWKQEQGIRRPEVSFGTWKSTNVLSLDEYSAIPPLDARSKEGKPLWTDCTEWKPSTIIIIAEEKQGEAVAMLSNTLTVPSAMTFSVGFAGGDSIDIYLNGTHFRTLDTRSLLRRYGTGLRWEQSFADRCILDLPLKQGENLLQLKITQGLVAKRYHWNTLPMSFWYSPAPNPVPHIWERVLRDYPRKDNPLLERVDYGWFDGNGWMAAGNADCQRRFLLSQSEKNEKLSSFVKERLKTLEPLPADDSQWINTCAAVAEAAYILEGLGSLESAVERLSSSYPQKYPAAEIRRSISAMEQEILARVSNFAIQYRFDEMPARLKKLKRLALVEQNPLLKNRKLVFARRYTYDSQHYYDDYYHGPVRWGGNITELDLASGRIRDIIDKRLEGGIFDRYDISHDGERIVFGYRPCRPEGYRLWEQNIDGAALRQLTFAPENEEERVYSHSGYSMKELERDPRLYGHWTDDMHPCYLPDGRIVFVSSRSDTTVLCGGHSLTCTALHRIDADGSNMRKLSQGALTESTPVVMNDGRILYTRWEYVFKGIAAVQSLWSMRPDGTGSEEVYGNNIDNPGVFFAGRQIPGSPDRIVALGCSHEPLAVGSIFLVDRKKDRRSKEAMQSITPWIETEGLRGLFQYRNGRRISHDTFGPFYCDPFPLSGDFFLVSYNPDKRYNDIHGYQIALIDTFGNCVPVYEDPELSCFQPMLLEPRPVQPILPCMCDESDTGRNKDASVMLVDLYRGLKGVTPGTVKYLRILEQIPRSWESSQIRSGDGYPGQATAVSLSTHIWIAVLLGVVPVEDDGSAYFKVPSNRNIFIEALDENYMQVQVMRSFVNLQPGEKRSCIGCHDPRDGSQMPSHPKAMAKGIVSIMPQPGDSGPRPVHYPSDVQPVFDKHCIRCHGGEAPKAGLDLRGTLTDHFSVSYENLLVKGCVPFIQEWIQPPEGKRGPMHVGNGSMLFAEAKPAYSCGSHASKLMTQLLKGHKDVKLSREEFVRLATWVDANAQFYGSYHGKKNICYKDDKDFRPVPTLESARGIKPCLPRPAAIPARLVGTWKGGEDNGLPGSFDGRTFVNGGGKGHNDAISVALRVKAGALHYQWNPLLFTDGRQQGAFHFSLLEDGTPNVAVNCDGTQWNHAKAKRILDDGEFHNLAVICDGRAGGWVRFYIDAKFAGEAPLDANVPLDLDAFRIGAWNSWENTPENNFHGCIKELCLYQGMLTEQEITLLAEKGDWK